MVVERHSVRQARNDCDSAKNQSPTIALIFSLRPVLALDTVGAPRRSLVVFLPPSHPTQPSFHARAAASFLPFPSLYVFFFFSPLRVPCVALHFVPTLVAPWQFACAREFAASR